MRRWALVIFILLLLAAGVFARWRGDSHPAAKPLPCSPVAVVVEPGGDWLACLDDPAFAGCNSIKPGHRYDHCQLAGTVSGAILAFRGQPLSARDATEDDLVALPGIGPALAKRIVSARESHPLCSPEDLQKVPGIGVKRAQALTPHLLFDDPLCLQGLAR